MPIDFRTAAVAEYPDAIRVIGTAFLEWSNVDAIAAAIEDAWDPARLWIAWDGATACGTLRTGLTELTVPGGATLPAATLTAVTVLPTHRRRGILRGLVAREHAAIVERGEAVGLLYASEYPIYGRFGYAPGTEIVEWTIGARATRMHGDPSGTVEHAAQDAAARDVLKGVFEAWRHRRAGEIARRDIAWDVRLGLRDEPWGDAWKGWLLLHRDAAGTVDGYARYKASPKWESTGPNGELDVAELVTLTDDAAADIVRHLIGVDLVATVKLGHRPPGDAFRWRLTNARAARQTDRGDGMWVRLFDVPRALAARTYERAAAIVIEVVDEPAFGGTRRFALDAGPDGTTCRPTDRSPDLTLPVAALGGAYLGGTRLRDLVLVAGADEHRAGALAEADALLHTDVEPQCSTFF